MKDQARGLEFVQFLYGFRIRAEDLVNPFRQALHFLLDAADLVGCGGFLDGTERIVRLVDFAVDSNPRDRPVLDEFIVRSKPEVLLLVHEAFVHLVEAIRFPACGKSGLDLSHPVDAALDGFLLRPSGKLSTNACLRWAESCVSTMLTSSLRLYFTWVASLVWVASFQGMVPSTLTTRANAPASVPWQGCVTGTDSEGAIGASESRMRAGTMRQDSQRGIPEGRRG